MAVQVSSMKTRCSGSRVDLTVEPVPTLPQDVATDLLDLVPGLFSRDPVAQEEPVHGVEPDRCNAFYQPRLILDQAHVSLLGDQLPDEASWVSILLIMPAHT